uniref:CCHC-type domain-containing protein n=1 Tax=Cyprinus carpio carpio TaxID=630221 RepID=A0A9J7YPY9_CYPCA
MANDTGLAGERRMANDTGLEYRQRAVHGKNQDARHTFGERKYLKEATVIVNVENVSEVRAVDIIKAVTDKCGYGKILALRPRQGKEYELTMEKEETCDELTEGLLIKGVNCEIKKLQNRDYVVSFMHLPVYLADEEILNKLEVWGVSPISKIKRRVYPGTSIEDGTRYVKARFPKEVASLPYSTKMETAEGPQYFRVMHSHQVKTCRLCMSPDHVVKDCPEFKCYKCEERGHFARNCNAVMCPDCNLVLNKCECWMEGEEEEGRAAGGQAGA